MTSQKPKTEELARRNQKSPSSRLKSPKKQFRKAKSEGREKVSIGFATIHKDDNSDEFL
jgi:hypothetical protein